MITHRAAKRTCSMHFALSLAVLSGICAFYAGMAYAPRPKVALASTARPAAYPSYFQPAPTSAPVPASLPQVSQNATLVLPVPKAREEEAAMNLPQLPKYGMAALGQEGAWAGDEASAKSDRQRRDHKGNLCLDDVSNITTSTLRTMLPPGGVFDVCLYKIELSHRADITPGDYFSDEMSGAPVVSSLELSKLYRGGKWSISDFEKMADSEKYGYSAALPLYLILKQENSPAAQMMLTRKNDTIIPQDIKQFLETGICHYGEGPLCLEK